MPASESSIGIPVLEEAIDRHPLVVTPDTLLTDAILLMSRTRAQSCSLAKERDTSQTISNREARSSCVLVMDSSELLGIFTERDIVWLTAQRLNWEQVRIAQVMAQPVISLNEADFQDIFAALFLFRRYRIRHLPIIGKEGQLVGVVSPESIRHVLRPVNLLKLRRVSEIMTPEVIQAPLNASVLRLARLMAENRVSCVVITEECVEAVRLPVGIVTERDIVQFQALGLKLTEILAAEVMSTPLFLLKPSDSLWSAHQEMQERRVRRLVVSWNWGQGLGIVTQTSLLRVFDPMEMYGVIETLQRTVRQLAAEKAEGPLKEGAEKYQTKGGAIPHLSEPSAPEIPILPRLRSSLDNICHHQNGNQALEWDSLLRRLQTSLSSLLNNPKISPERRQQLLQEALANVEGLGKLRTRGDVPDFLSL